MSITGSNNPFPCDPVVFANANAIISLGTITRVGNVFTFSVGFVWKISGVTYQNTAPVVITIAEATEGFNRIDNALLNTANTIELQQGAESETIALQPTFPDNTILLTTWNISGETIGDTVTPDSITGKEDKASGVIALGTDNYTTTVPDVNALVAGYKILCSFENVNTGASTINVNELGVKQIVKEDDAQMVAGDLLGTHLLMYNGTKFQIVGHVPAPTDTFKTKAVASTGNTIQFDKDRIYNSIASPTTGTMSNNLTGAQIGVIQKIYYNHSTTNPFPVGWVRLGSKEYTASELNIIYAEWVGSSRVEYWISQEA